MRRLWHRCVLSPSLNGGPVREFGFFLASVPLSSRLLTKRDPELANVINTAQTVTRALV